MTSKVAGRIIMTLRTISAAAADWQRSAYCGTFHKQWTTNDAVKWVASYTRKVPGSNLRRETGYPDRHFSRLSSVAVEKCRGRSRTMSWVLYRNHSLTVI
jgi:hypothetical protein